MSKQSISKKIGMYDGVGCSTRATRKNTWICPNENCKYTSRRFYDLEKGHSNFTISLHTLSIKNSVCSIHCPIHGHKLLFLGDIWRLPKNEKKRAKMVRELKKKYNDSENGL